MKAVLLTKLGATGNLIYKYIDTPHFSKNEALIKIKYCGLNHLDLLIQQGKRPGPKKFPHILGSEIVGVIEQINSKSSSFKIGDKVSIYPWLFCGKCQPCLTGNENICDNGGTIGRTGWGGYAEYVVVPIRNLLKIPEGLFLDKVCASTLTATTAYHLINRAKIKDKSIVLITGATGGVGSIAIQLLRNKQCKIIAATSHENKIRPLKKLGVNNVVSTQTLTEQIKKLYPRGVDYVIDIMGGMIWSNSVEILAKNGTLVFCATTLDGLGTVNIGSAFSRQVNILGSYGGRIKDLKAVLSSLKKKLITPVIDSIYPLEEAATALKKLEKQKTFGKILLNNEVV